MNRLPQTSGYKKRFSPQLWVSHPEDPNVNVRRYENMESLSLNLFFSRQGQNNN
jgi:hypothetical protein